MAAYCAKSMKPPDLLEYCNVCFRDWVAVRSAAAPQGHFEPNPEVVFRNCSQMRQSAHQNHQPQCSKKSRRSCKTQRVFRHRCPTCGQTGQLFAVDEWQLLLHSYVCQHCFKRCAVCLTSSGASKNRKPRLRKRLEAQKPLRN